MPLISVLMGVYNCRDKELLRKSVASISAQTEKDWEFLICDDGSADDTLAFLYELQKEEPRIRVLSGGTNGGLAHALNICLREAKGTYIARQDDTDTSVPDRFERELDFLRQHDEYDFVCSAMDLYDDTGVWGHQDYVPVPERRSFLWNSPYAHATMMIPREKLIAGGGYREVPETRRCEDYDLFMRLYAAGLRGYNLPDRLYAYRVIIGKKKYRPMHDRIDEAKVRLYGFRLLGLYPVGILYVLKPVLIGLLPQSVFGRIRRKQFR